MKKINNKAIYGFYVLIIITMCFYSCVSKKTGYIKDKVVERKLNDSLYITIFFNEKYQTIRTLIIENRNNKIKNIYGFRDNGITPVMISRAKNGVRDGLCLTFYSNGILNSKISYVEGEIDGEKVVYSEDGSIIYKASYKKGIEKQVEICDSTLLDIEFMDIHTYDH